MLMIELSRRRDWQYHPLRSLYVGCNPKSMADQNANTDPKINRGVEELKSKIPAADHGALDSRLQALINDPDTDDDDVISILRKEFDPEHG